MRNFLLGALSGAAAVVVMLSVMLLFNNADSFYRPWEDFSPISFKEPTISNSTITLPVAEPSKKTVMTTLFWVGEGSTEENGYISNVQSYWDEQWGEHFGGIDDPENRCGYTPCTFTPKENPFYIALPYGEFDQNADKVKPSAVQVPWYGKDSKPLIKNRWVEVTYQGKICYGQWEDVGPYLEDDFSYVFGEAEPHNTFGMKAGLDISPALWDCLGMDDNALTSWRFVSVGEVPAGPWNKTVTTSKSTWFTE